jgi:hypothetical protein|uniref:Uncharacterized protein n=1 Tax=Myoviridae sp. ctshb19 TaxID=2825194 RepID=A0A8S5UGI4_9CAUD|nr:MAG TPA: hypothetical protein [Myoviridae sp. ctshb19]
MKFLGVEIEIRRVKADEDVPSASKAMALLEGPQVSRRSSGIRTFRKPKITDMIIFPEPDDLSDVWQAQALTNLVAKIEKSFNYYGWVDICTVDEAVRQFNIPQNRRSKLAYEKLHTLHCVHFNKYLPGIMEQVPDLYTCIFTGGVFPKEPMEHEKEKGGVYEAN